MFAPRGSAAGSPKRSNRLRSKNTPTRATPVEPSVSTCSWKAAYEAVRLTHVEAEGGLPVAPVGTMTWSPAVLRGTVEA